MKNFMKIPALMLYALLSVAASSAFSCGFANAIVAGDVFAAVGNGTVDEYNSSLQLIGTLHTGVGGFTTGMAFDSSLNLYVTDFSTNQVSVFNNVTGALTGTFGSGYATPESIVFDEKGDAYISNVSGSGPLEFNAAGTLINSFTNVGRTDWLDLAADQHTLYITNEGSTVERYDTATKTFLADFATGLTHAYALRILANGDVLVADTNNIKLFDPNGNLLKTYGVNGVSDFFALNIGTDQTTFLSGSFDNGTFYEFNIATGAVLATVDTGSGSGEFFGLAIAGEPTVGTGGGGGTNVPEPGSLALLGTALVAAGVVLRRRRQV